MIDVTNAFVDGRDLVLLKHGVAGIEQERVPAEYSFFVKTSELPAALEQSLRAARSVSFMRKEGKAGEWTRIAWVDDWARRAQIYGRKDKASGIKYPSPFQAQGIEIFEGDVDPVRRWFTDNDGRVAKPIRGYFDFETDSRVPPRLAREGHARILSISLASEDEAKQWLGIAETFDDDGERKLIYAWLDKIREWGMTQLLAWGGENFDFGAFAGRVERLGIRYDRRAVLWLDHLLMFRRMNLNSSDSGAEKQSMALNSIAQAVLKEGKEEVPEVVAKRWPGRSLGSLAWELWEAGGEFRELLGRYNMKDTLLMCRIERKTGFAALFDTLCDVCKVLPDSRGLKPTKQMDGFMLRLGLERDYHFPTKFFSDDEEESKPFDGAFVMEPKESGILRDVHVADFASLYPSVIITWNMSPETKISGYYPPSGPDADERENAEPWAWSPLTKVCFRQDVEGILPAALKVMLALRKEWSTKEASLPPGTPAAKEAKRRSMAYKVAANSFFGVVGASSSRYFDREVAESITQNAKWLILQTIAQAELRGMTVFYGDTDSFFARNVTKTGFGDFVAWANSEFYPRVLRELGCVANRVSLAYEKQFSLLAMLPVKKRYAGVFAHYKGSPGLPMPLEGEDFDDKRHSRPEIKGLEFKRGDAAVLATRLQERVIMALMRGDHDPKKHRGYVQDALKHIAEDILPVEEIQVSKGINKPFAEYHGVDANGREKPIPVHVKVAEEMIKKGGDLGEGARVSYVVVDGRDGIKAIPSHEYDGECDRYYLWENTIYPATQRVLEACFPKEDWDTGLASLRPKGRGVVAGQVGLFGGVDPIGDAALRREKARRAAIRAPELEDEARHLAVEMENAMIRKFEARRWLA